MIKKSKKDKQKELWSKGEGEYSEWPVYPSSSWAGSEAGEAKLDRDSGGVVVSYGTGSSGAPPSSTEQNDPTLYGVSSPLQSQFETDAISGQYTFDYDLSEPRPFQRAMPSLSQVEEMCKIYPSLKIAYEKFKNIYRIVYDDYATRDDDV